MFFAAATTDSLEIGAIAMALFGGLALFLYGMDQMSDALKLVAGDGRKRVLAKLTTNRFTGAIAGAIVTAVIQSSSITTVLVVGFISAGLMSLSQSAGVIMGANIGTTITAQIIAFKVTHYALILVAVGFCNTVRRQEREGSALWSHDHGSRVDLFRHASDERGHQALTNLRTVHPDDADNGQSVRGDSPSSCLHRAGPEFLSDNRYRDRVGRSGVHLARGWHCAHFRREHRHMRDGHAGVYPQTTRSSSSRGGPRGL